MPEAPLGYDDIYVVDEDTRLVIAPTTRIAIQLMDLDSAIRFEAGIPGNSYLQDNPYGELVFTIDGVEHTLTWSPPGDPSPPQTYADLLAAIQTALTVDPAFSGLIATFGASFVATDTDADPGGSAVGIEIVIEPTGSANLGFVGFNVTDPPPPEKDFHAVPTVSEIIPPETVSSITLELMNVDSGIRFENGSGTDSYLSDVPYGAIDFLIDGVPHRLTWSPPGDPSPPQDYSELLAAIQAALVADPAFDHLIAYFGRDFKVTDTDADPGGSAFGLQIWIQSSYANVDLEPVALVTTSAPPPGTLIHAQTGTFEWPGLWSVLDNDNDVDGDPLTTMLVSDVAHGTLTFNADGSFFYDPDPDFSGSDSFTYIANDGTFDSNLVTVTIDVRPVNDAPVAADDLFAVDEDAAITGNVLINDSDPDAGDVLVVTAIGAGAPGAALTGLYGTLTLLADGNFTYVADADILDVLDPASGPVSESFTYTMADAAGLTSSADLTFDIAILADGIVVTPGRGGGSSSISGTDGDDVIGGGTGKDTIDGGAGGDRLSGGNGKDSIFGGAGIDLLDGGRGKDLLDGGPGDDVLIGGPGNDEMTGGTGADIFAYLQASGSEGTDTITDFTIGEDLIYLAPGITIDSVVSAGGSTALALSNGSSVILAGVAALPGAPTDLLVPVLPEWV